MNIRLAKNHYF